MMSPPTPGTKLTLGHQSTIQPSATSTRGPSGHDKPRPAGATASDALLFLSVVLRPAACARSQGTLRGEQSQGHGLGGASWAVHHTFPLPTVTWQATPRAGPLDCHG